MNKLSKVQEVPEDQERKYPYARRAAVAGAAALLVVGAVLAFGRDDAEAPALNGRLESDDLQIIATEQHEGHQLSTEAAETFDDMSEAYAREFGNPLDVTGGYLSFDEQDANYQKMAEEIEEPWIAPAGYHTHGMGTAADIAGPASIKGTEQYDWLVQEGPTYGWTQDESLSRPGDPEPHHITYRGVTAAN